MRLNVIFLYTVSFFTLCSGVGLLAASQQQPAIACKLSKALLKANTVNLAKPKTHAKIHVNPQVNRLNPVAPTLNHLALNHLEKPTYTLHWLKVPAQSLWVVVPQAINPALAKTSPVAFTLEGWHQQLPTSHFLLNGGYFDPLNQQTISWVQTLAGTLLNPTLNERLTANPSLTPWLPAIFNRSELQTLQCNNNVWKYRITQPNNTLPAEEEGCVVKGRLGGGPQLLPTLTAEAEAFWASNPGTGKITRNPIGLNTPNARSAVGLTATGEVLLVMVEQKTTLQNKATAEDTPTQKATKTASGVTLAQLAEELKALGAVQALNLDGGSSSSLWHSPSNGQTGAIYGYLHPNGQPVQRKVLSVLSVEPKPE